MLRIPKSEIERIKADVDLAALVRSRGIELRKHGSKDLIGKCPFHDEKNPSLVVTSGKNLFHCMGCGAAGSAIDFVMRLDGLTFREAAGMLAGAAPAIQRSGGAAKEKKVAVAPERANRLLERVVSIYEQNLDEGRAYLEKRGIADAGLFAKHRIGFADGKLKDLLPKDGAVRDELAALGVLLPGGAERFAGCAVFPVFDAEGNLTTLYGRFAGEGSRRHVFLPERPTGLWNAAAMKTYPDLILVESAIDALSVMVAGHPNVIAIQGTNGMNDADAALLRSHGVRSVTLLLDGDAAGTKAARRLKEKLSSSFSCRVLDLPDEHDPNGFLVEYGAGKLAEFLASAASSPGATKACPSAISAASARDCAASSDGLALNCGLRRYEVRGLEKGARKLKATLRVEHAGRLHVDTLDLYSARSRKVLAIDLCRLFGEAPETIESDIDRLLRHCEGLPDRAAAEAAEAKPAEATLSPKERAEAEAFGRNPKLLETILADFEACGLVGEKANKLLCYLAMTSRKTDEPLSVLILSSSGAGKTALQDAALDFCPPEDLVKLTSLSGKALFYKEQFSLKHKVLALEEGAGAEEATYAIRNLVTAKELVIESAIKDPASGKITTMSNRVEGPTPVFITTTDPSTNPETKSRFFVTSIDESREQTRAILSFQRRRQTLDGLAHRAATDAILARHRNFQRLLKPLAVINPHAAQLAYGDDRLQGRRDQPKYLNLIKAVAFLRQMQKPVKTFARNGTSFEYVEADREDIRIAGELARDILGHSLDELSRPSRDLLLQLEAMVRARLKERKTPGDGHEAPRAGAAFTRREVRAFTGWSNYRVHTHLRELIEFEYLAVESDRNTGGHRYRLLYDGQGKDGERFVIGLSR